MSVDDVFTQRAARAAQLRADLIEYEKALDIVRALEAKWPEFAVDRRAEPKPEPEPATKSAELPDKPAIEGAADATLPPKAEALKGANMQETVYNAVKRIAIGEEFEPERVFRILESDAPMAAAVFEIDEKKVRDVLGRLMKDPERGIKRTREGTRGRKSVPPAFERHEVKQGSGPSSASSADELTIADYAEAALEKMGPPFRPTQELMGGMSSEGWETDAKDPYSTVFGTLRREPGKEGSRLVKRDGKWGLKDWLEDQETGEVTAEDGNADEKRRPPRTELFDDAPRRSALVDIHDQSLDEEDYVEGPPATKPQSKTGGGLGFRDWPDE
jgi:hypothetical protein